MTDYNAVKNELYVLTEYESGQLDKYDGIIESVCDSVSSQLKSSELEADKRIIHLAAAKCYYQILLLNQSESLTSFKAGDISYTMSSASVEGARELYDQAVKDCADLLKTDSFAFEAV